MYRITQENKTLAFVERPVFIRKHSNGCFVPTDEEHAEGLAVGGVAYSLFEHTPMEGAAGTVICRELDGGEVLMEAQTQTAAQSVIAAALLGAEVEITPEVVELATAGADIAALPDSGEWRPGVRVETGARVGHEGASYECVQGHVTLANWPPGATPALWTLVQAEPEPGQTLPWAAGEAVKAGDVRTYGGKTYECVQGHTTQSGWEPPNLPALWRVAQ